MLFPDLERLQDCSGKLPMGGIIANGSTQEQRKPSMANNQQVRPSKGRICARGAAAAPATTAY